MFPIETKRSIPRDLLAGLAAIVCTVAISIRAQFVGSDMRYLFAVTGVAFFLAGILRGKSVPQNPLIKAVLVSSPGLLGTAALILNDGLHRITLPITVSFTAILATLVGVGVRRLWHVSPKKSSLLMLAAAATLAAFCVIAVPRLVLRASSKQTVIAAPTYSVLLADGRQLNSSDLRGKIVVLAFWATWCLPCLWELPELSAVSSKFQQNPQVIFLAVDANWGGESPEKARAFFAKRKLTMPWAFDNGGAAKALSVDSLPTIVVLDRQGRIRFTHYGYDASEHIQDMVRDQVSSLLSDGGR